MFNPPTIEIKFGTLQDTNEQILSVYIKTLQEAIDAARGDLDALKKMDQLVKEAQWLIDERIVEAYNAKGGNYEHYK